MVGMRGGGDERLDFRERMLGDYIDGLDEWG